MHDASWITRRHALGLLVAGAASSVLGAEAPSRELKITVKDEFQGAPPSNIAALLKSAGGELWKHCPHTKLLGSGMHIYRHPKYPITHYDQDAEGRIVIGLSTDGTYWSQYSFQFGHEFCHALLDHTDERQWKFGEHANHWVDESLCETASLFALRGMSKSWETSPPYSNWKSYAGRLAGYAQNRLDDAKRGVPEGMSFAEWFAAELPGLRERSTQREKNLVIAAQLLPLFEAEPSGWESLTTMKLGTRDVRKPLAEHFVQWRANAPEAQRPFITKIAGVFQVG